MADDMDKAVPVYNRFGHFRRWSYHVEGKELDDFEAIRILQHAGFTLGEAATYLNALQREAKKCTVCLYWKHEAKLCRNSNWSGAAYYDPEKPICSGFSWSPMALKPVYGW